MTLLWKLLRQHLSAPQLAGFALANLAGTLIVALSLQFYQDLRPLLTQSDTILSDDYLIVSKQFGSLGANATFTADEERDLLSQPFASSVGEFTASQYKVSCTLGMQGLSQMGTQMYFESLPDEFVDADLSQWSFEGEGSPVPIILPRNYLAIYNFGFAQSRSLPKLSESLVKAASLTLTLSGAGHTDRLQGRIVGFSSRLSTILVPEDFMQWSNERYAPESDTSPSRLIMRVANPADEAIATYMQERGYSVDEDKLSAGKTMYFLRLLVTIVMAVGLAISALSFYILTLSIYLLVEKNTQKLENLLLIGYTPAQVCLPYQLLAATVNTAVLLVALIALILARNAYTEALWQMFPAYSAGTMWQACTLATALCLAVTLLNALAVRRTVSRLQKR